MDKVVHFEIPADDLARAKKFYQDIFGWQMQDVPMDYTLVTTVSTDEKGMPTQPGAINGGLTKRQAAGDKTTIVINVSTIDDYLSKVEAMGGKVVTPKHQVGDMGLYAKVTDTEGNLCGTDWPTTKRLRRPSWP